MTTKCIDNKLKLTIGYQYIEEMNFILDTFKLKLQIDPVIHKQ